MGKISLMLLALAWSLMATTQAAAEPASRLESCIFQAGAYQKIDPLFLLAIAQQESAMNPKAKNRNVKGGTTDHGAMQINDEWVPRLKKFGITKNDLYDACVSAYVGAWILAQEIARHGYTWKAIGAYNAKSPDKQEIYARLIYQRWVKLAVARK